MKHNVLTSLLVGLLTIVGVSTVWAYQGGDGTSADPYLISNTSELQAFASDVNGGQVAICGKLTADIDMSAISWNTPIAATTDKAYTGIFDGDGYRISNLHGSSSPYLGLFGVAKGATIKNLIVENASFSSYYYAAAIVGYVLTGATTTFDHCAARGTLNFTNVDDGGLACTQSGGGNIAAAISCYTTKTWIFSPSYSASYGSATNCFMAYGMVNLSTALTSGRVAFAINNRLGAGTWKQNLDNDSTPDAYPELRRTGADVYCISENEEYTNTQYTRTVSFDNNGGSGSMSSITVSGCAQVNKCTSMTKNGLLFQCWNTQQDGSGIEVPDGGMVYTGTSNEPLTLYAQWGTSRWTRIPKNCYVNTGYIPKSTTRIEISFQFANRVGTYNHDMVFGCHGSHWFYVSCRKPNETNVFCVDAGKDGGQESSVVTQLNTTYIWKVTPGSGAWVTNASGTTVASWGSNIGSQSSYGDYPVYIGGCNNSNSFQYDSDIRLYYLTIKEGDVIKKNFEPRVNENGDPIILETVDSVEVPVTGTPPAGTDMGGGGKAYEVNFEANGGSGTMTAQKIYTKGNLKANTFTKTNFTFNGWNTLPNGLGDSYANQASFTAPNSGTGKTTLYAQWKKTLVVTFNPNGGEALSKDTLHLQYYTPYGNNMPTPTISDSVLRFDGWFTAQDGGEKVESHTLVLNENDHTLWAHWSKYYTITFDKNAEDATVSPTEKEFKLNEPYIELPTPVRTGYTFEGWFTEPSGGTIVVASDTMKREENHTLYAHWETIKYQVTFINASGSVSKESMEVAYDAAYGELATATHTTPTDYINRGWNTQSDGQGTTITAESIVKTAQDHSLYAQWEQKSDTVTLHLNYDVADTVFGTFIGKWGNTYNDTRLDNYTSSPYRYGWQCVGWFTQKEGGTQVTSSTEVARQNRITLYAHWELKTMNVSFYPQGGSSCDPKQVTYSQQYGPLPTPTMTNYTFLGWLTGAKTGDTIKSTTIVTAEEDHYLYAQWDGKTVVTYNANGGTCATKTKDVIYGSQYGTLATPTRDGYTFNGWYTEQTGGTKVQASTTVTNPENHTLWAHWTANNYTVTFNPNGGTVNPTQKNVTYDAAYSTLPVPTRSPYIFTGWFTQQTGGDLVTAETTVKTANNHTLWAHWYIPEVTDGTGMDSTSAKKAANDSLTSWAAKSTGSNTINVVIKRTIYKDGYFNTLCLPFDLTAAQIAATFKEDPKELKEYLSCSVQGKGDDRELVIETQDATTITAGKAYLISFENGTTLTELLFPGVKVSQTAPIVAETSGEASYQGILAPKVLPYGNEDYLFLGEENRLYWPKNDGTFLRGFRAYFKVETSPEPQAPVKRGMKASFGKKTPTANDNVNVNDNNEIKKLIEDGRVVIKTNGVKYDMNGKRL